MTIKELQVVMINLMERLILEPGFISCFHSYRIILGCRQAGWVWLILPLACLLHAGRDCWGCECYQRNRKHNLSENGRVAKSFKSLCWSLGWFRSACLQRVEVPAKLGFILKALFIQLNQNKNEEVALSCKIAMKRLADRLENFLPPKLF